MTEPIGDYLFREKMDREFLNLEKRYPFNFKEGEDIYTQRMKTEEGLNTLDKHNIESLASTKNILNELLEKYKSNDYFIFKLTKFNDRLKAIKYLAGSNITDAKKRKSILESNKKNLSLFIEHLIAVAIEGEREGAFDSENDKPHKTIDFNTQIFKSEKGFLLFEALLEAFPKGVNDNYAFIFLQLQKDGYIFEVSHRIFINFLSAAPYNIVIDKIKTWNILATKNRLALYSTTLKAIKYVF